MNKLILFVSMIFLLSCAKNDKNQSQVLVNHLGYQSTSIKKLVFQTKGLHQPQTFEVVNTEGTIVYKGKFDDGDGAISNWSTGNAYSGYFTDFKELGQYMIRVKLDSKVVESVFFEIKSDELANELLPLLLDGFKSQRCKDPYNSKDKKMTFFGDRTDTVDVSGGWYDASGEKGKYLSHLNFSNYMTPQQLPMMVWNLLETASSINSEVRKAIEEEAAFGADYLVRVQDKDGYFYTTVFANWTKDPAQREIAAYEGQDGRKNANYQAAFREGGGMAIAALARMSQTPKHGEFSNDKYLEVAVKGFDHLIDHNLDYTDDGQENIIDDYCALMASKELYSATNEAKYLEHARKRAHSLINRLSSDAVCKNWLRADQDGKRPYFHGAEAGLPIIALCQYILIEQEGAHKLTAVTAVQNMVNFELNISNEVYNPFGYARQYVKATDEDAPRSAFFLPHQNETGYWWQGENARIASLATAMYMAKEHVDANKKRELEDFASNQINWILGLNPFNMCMLQGAGHNNPIYKEEGISYNYEGGVCNGITAGFIDESDIAFMPLPQNNDPAQRWRWSEQWLQHGGWLMPALALQMKYHK